MCSSDLAVEVRRIGADEGAALGEVDLAFIGGGQDAEQVAVAAGLERLGPSLVEAVRRGGTTLLAVCGGYQNLARSYRSELVGELRGPGLIDAATEAPPGPRG